MNLFQMLPSHVRTKAPSRGKVAVPNFLSEKQVPPNVIRIETRVIPILNIQNRTIDRFSSVSCRWNNGVIWPILYGCSIGVVFRSSENRLSTFAVGQGLNWTVQLRWLYRPFSSANVHFAHDRPLLLDCPQKDRLTSIPFDRRTVRLSTLDPIQIIISVSEPNLKLRSRLKQKQERRNSPLMARKSPGNEVLTERIRRKISTNSMGEKEHENFENFENSRNPKMGFWTFNICSRWMLTWIYYTSTTPLLNKCCSTRKCQGCPEEDDGKVGPRITEKLPNNLHENK